MKPVCLNCGGQGWAQSPHVYDCNQCDVAETRTALEAALRADEALRGKMDFEDQLLFAYNFKMEKTMSDEKIAAPSVDHNAVPVGEATTMPGTSGFTMVCFKASDVPLGTKLYAAPVAQPLAPSVDYSEITGQLDLPDLSGNVYERIEQLIDRAYNSTGAAQPLAGQDGRAVTDPHWYDTPQSALGGKTAREGYMANPEYANTFLIRPAVDWNTLREQLESKVIDAALDLAQHTGCDAFSLPVKNTTPQLLVTLAAPSPVNAKQEQ